MPYVSDFHVFIRVCIVSRYQSVINTLCSINKIKSAAKIIRQSLLQIDFGLQDKFCHAEELKFAWKNTKIPDELLTFFAELFNIKKTTLLKDYYEDTDDEENDFRRCY